MFNIESDFAWRECIILILSIAFPSPWTLRIQIGRASVLFRCLVISLSFSRTAMREFEREGQWEPPIAAFPAHATGHWSDRDSLLTPSCIGHIWREAAAGTPNCHHSCRLWSVARSRTGKEKALVLCCRSSARSNRISLFLPLVWSCVAYCILTRGCTMYVAVRRVTQLCVVRWGREEEWGNNPFINYKKKLEV